MTGGDRKFEALPAQAFGPLVAGALMAWGLAAGGFVGEVFDRRYAGAVTGAACFAVLGIVLAASLERHNKDMLRSRRFKVGCLVALVAGACAAALVLSR
jgi:hypothetical protein